MRNSDLENCTFILHKERVSVARADYVFAREQFLLVDVTQSEKGKVVTLTGASAFGVVYFLFDNQFNLSQCHNSRPSLYYYNSYNCIDKRFSAGSRMNG